MEDKIKAIIFDMDGVLIDAKDWHYEALNKALGLFGHNISRHDHLVTFDGIPTAVKLNMLTLERGLPEKIHEFVNDLKQKQLNEWNTLVESMYPLIRGNIVQKEIFDRVIKLKDSMPSAKRK